MVVPVPPHLEWCCEEDIVTSHALQLFTDASSLGFGAVYGDWWMSVGWPPSTHVYDINFLELFAIVAAVLTWGAGWSNKQILIYTDNEAITHIWRTGSCRNKDIMHLV